VQASSSLLIALTQKGNFRACKLWISYACLHKTKGSKICVFKFKSDNLSFKISPQSNYINYWF